MEKIAAIKFKQLLLRKKREKSYDSLFWNGSKPLLSKDPMKNDKILLSKIVKSYQKYSRYYECYFSSIEYNFKSGLIAHCYFQVLIKSPDGHAQMYSM